MLACGGPGPQLFRPGGSGSDDAADGLRTPAVCGRFAFTERFGSPPVQLEVALGPAIERDYPANLAELTCSVFDLEDRQQPVLFADSRKQLNQPPHVRAIVVELLLEHPGLVSRVSPHRCSGHRYHLDGHPHPLAGLTRRYRLASAGTGISAVSGLAVATASTLGRIDQIGTVSGAVQGSALEGAGAGASSTRTVARHGHDFWAVTTTCSLRTTRGRVWDDRRGHPADCGDPVGRFGRRLWRPRGRGKVRGWDGHPADGCQTAEPL